MPLFTQINSWKQLFVVSFTLYIPSLAILLYLSKEQNSAIAFAVTTLAWASYMIHLMLIAPATTLPSPIERKEPLLF